MPKQRKHDPNTMQLHELIRAADAGFRPPADARGRGSYFGDDPWLDAIDEPVVRIQRGT